jgi:hypothetical protein
MALGYWKALFTTQASGTALTAAAAASMLPAQAALWTLPAGFLDAPGKQLLLEAEGKISCAVTTPGTARFDLRFGGTVVFDTLAINLNIVAKANVHWLLRVKLTVQVVGSSAVLMPGGVWISEAVIGSPLPTVGGSGVVTVPYNTAPVSGATFASNAAQTVDAYFTQTVATGSMTCTQFGLYSPTTCD